MRGYLAASLIHVGSHIGSSFLIEFDETDTPLDVLVRSRAAAARFCRHGAIRGDRKIAVVTAASPFVTGVAWQAIIVTDDQTVDAAIDGWQQLLTELVPMVFRPPTIAGTPIGNAPSTDTTQ